MAAFDIVFNEAAISQGKMHELGESILDSMPDEAIEKLRDLDNPSKVKASKKTAKTLK